MPRKSREPMNASAMHTESSSALAPARTPADALYRIRPGVAKVARADSFILVAPKDGRALRVTPVAEELLPLLAVGALFGELVQRLQQRHPKALDVETKLATFVDQLRRCGLIDTGAAPAEKRRPRTRFALLRPDSAAAWLAARIDIWPVWLQRAMLVLLVSAALAHVGALVMLGPLPHPSALWTEFNGWGLALFILVVVPLHEAAHALACRLAGEPVNEAGFILHGWIVPGPYVDTSQMYRVANRWQRFSVPAAGPLVDLLALGAAAAWLFWAAPAGSALHAAQTLFLLCALFLVLDTNPLAPSDGSRMLEAVLGDDLARRSALSRTRARLSSRKTVAFYRIACSTHLQSSALLIYLWWRAAAA